MNIKETKEIVAEFTKSDIEEMITLYADSKGYEVIKIIFQTETKHHTVSHQDMLMGLSGGSSIEFSGAKAFLKEKNTNQNT